jgi:hypothetical protein
MKAYEGVDVRIHVFLTSALVGDEWSPSLPGRFTPGERASGTHWIGGWMGPKTGLDAVGGGGEILPQLGLEFRPLGRPRIYCLHLQNLRISQARNEHETSNTPSTKVICSYKTSVDFRLTVRRHISENITLHSHCCENLKSNII